MIEVICTIDVLTEQMIIGNFSHIEKHTKNEMGDGRYGWRKKKF